MRSSREVAVRAIIFGTLGFRASLEVTEHPRSATLSAQLLPWLEQINLGGRLDEFHREILETPYGELPRESQAEAYWRGEAASLLGWTLQLFAKPDPVRPGDVGAIVERLKILQPSASDLVANAQLRSQHEIEDYCAYCLTVRQRFQRSTLDNEGQVVLERIDRAKLAELGLNEALHRQPELETHVSQLVESAPSARGLYVVRALAAEWLLGQEP